MNHRHTEVLFGNCQIPLSTPIIETNHSMSQFSDLIKLDRQTHTKYSAYADNQVVRHCIFSTGKKKSWLIWTFYTYTDLPHYWPNLVKSKQKCTSCKNINFWVRKYKAFKRNTYTSIKNMTNTFQSAMNILKYRRFSKKSRILSPMIKGKQKKDVKLHVFMYFNKKCTVEPWYTCIELGYKKNSLITRYLWSQVFFCFYPDIYNTKPDITREFSWSQGPRYFFYNKVPLYRDATRTVPKSRKVSVDRGSGGRAPSGVQGQRPGGGPS